VFYNVLEAIRGGGDSKIIRLSRRREWRENL
jgi:hypothetical protein